MCVSPLIIRESVKAGGGSVGKFKVVELRLRS